MSDTQQQHTDVGGNTQPQAQPASPPQSVPNQQPKAQQPAVPSPATPVGTVQKEHAPLVAHPDVKPADHAEISPQLAPEVKEVGVEHVPHPEHPQLTEEAIKAGLELAPSQQPISQATGQTVTFPGEMDEVKAEAVRKNHSWKDSLLWLVEEWWREKKKLREKEIEEKK